jgi:WD40 repeat protein
MLVLTGKTSRVRHLAFAPDGRTLASCAGNGGRIWLWDLTTGKFRRWLHGHKARLECLRFAPRGGWLASLDAGGTVALWQLDAPTPARLFAAARGHRVLGPHCLSFSPDGATLATPALIRRWLGLSSSYGVRVWDTATGRKLTSLAEHSHPVRAVAHAPDGRTLAAGDAGRVFKIWDIGSGQAITTLPQRTVMSGLAYTPDGNTLAMITGWSVVLWDIPRGQPRARLQGHKDRIWSLALSPDGRLLATASNDGTVRLWDVVGGGERAAFNWRIGKVYAVAFAPDGMRAAAGGHKDIVIWDID